MSRNPFAAPRTPREVADGVWLLGSRRVNFYLVEDGAALTLVDAGFAGHRRYLDGWLRHHGRALGDVEAVVLTHGHGDHTGFAPALAAHGVPVHLHPADTARAASPANRRPPQRMRANLHRPASLGFLAEAIADSALWQPLPAATTPLTPDQLHTAQPLPVPGAPVVIPVPGHTPGSVAVSFPDRHVLMTGDALMTYDPMQGHSGALVFAERTDDTPTALAALPALEAAGHHALLPGHGDPWLLPDATTLAITTARAV